MIDRYTLPKMKNIWSEENKFQQMLHVELAICKAWHQEGKISDEAIAIILEKADFQIDRILAIEKITHHDVIAFVSNVAENIGEEGRFIHMGATSSDILDTGLALQMKAAVEILLEDLRVFASICHEKAIQYKSVLTIGRTHGIHAEPTSFGLKFALWYAMTQQNIHRLQEVHIEIQQGKLSGAVGNYVNTNPLIEKLALSELGLSVAPIATQIIQRDIHAHMMNTIALIGSCFEQFAVEIRNLQRTEVGEVSEPFSKGQKGSSAMPHKKNPIISERVCGIARVLRGYSSTALENIPLWHERDISHSSAERIILPDACLLLDYMMSKFTSVIQDLNVYEKKIEENLWLTHGVFASQKILTLLIEEGFSREQAYALVQEAAFSSFQNNSPFQKELQQVPEICRHISGEKMEAMFSPDTYLKEVEYIFERIGICTKQ